MVLEYGSVLRLSCKVVCGEQEVMEFDVSTGLIQHVGRFSTLGECRLPHVSTGFFLETTEYVIDSEEEKVCSEHSYNPNVTWS